METKYKLGDAVEVSLKGTVTNITLVGKVVKYTVTNEDGLSYENAYVAEDKVYPLLVPEVAE